MLSTDEFASLSLWRRLGVNVHLRMCRHCRRFARQLAWLRKAAIGLGVAFDSEIRAEFLDQLHQSVGR